MQARDAKGSQNEVKSLWADVFEEHAKLGHPSLVSDS